MKDLIEALQILLKYSDPSDKFPTHCEHDILYIGAGIDDLSKISKEDIDRLDELGIIWSDEHEGFISFRFGSC